MKTTPQTETADETPHPIAKVIIMILFIIAGAAFLLPMAVAFFALFLPLFLLGVIFGIIDLDKPEPK